MKRSYTIEFKKQAVELAESLGNISQAAKQLGIATVNISQWKKALEPASTEKKVASSLSQSEHEELQSLRKEVLQLKKVNHILKSAAAFFSQDHLK